MKVAILGATSHIAKGLIRNFSKRDDIELFLYARNTEGLNSFLCLAQVQQKKITSYSMEKFGNVAYDTVINCVGIGIPDKVNAAREGIFFLTEQFDSLIMNYIGSSKKTKYINFSSGAIYGSSFDTPVHASSNSVIEVNNITAIDYYRIAKINSEAKHRATNAGIIDLRIFNYFSRDIDITSKYLITEIITCIKEKKPFRTGSNNLFRDFVHPGDLSDLVYLCLCAETQNAAFDVYSASPISKQEILEYFKKTYFLEVNIDDSQLIHSATGCKNIYYSTNKEAERLQYFPRFSSMDAIVDESSALLNSL